MSASRKLAWLVLLGYAAVIFWLSSQANPLPALTAHVWDKLLHLCEYGGLGFLFALALAGSAPLGWRELLVASALVGFLYGASDELHQSFVPGRDAEVGDVIADVLGALLGGGVATLFSRGRRPSAAS